MRPKLNTGDWVLLRRLSDKDPNVPKYLEGLWVPYDGSTWYNNITVRIPGRHWLKVSGRKRWYEYKHSYVALGTRRMIKPSNIVAIARYEKNIRESIKITRGDNHGDI